ncbi:MAG: ABC transporter permease [Gracilibacter sp. BRH_c7a]|nr:MAG: ABC transporter permease [Gracilibacter sp. BRH_c7a]
MQISKIGWKTVQFFLAIVFILLSWWIFALLLETPAFPPPLEAFTSFFKSMQGDMLLHLRISFYRVAASLLMAAVLGIPAGLFLGKNPHIDQYISPVIYLTYPIPKVVFLPVLLILLGIGDLSKVVLIALIVFYQILVTTRDAARNLQTEYIVSVKSLGANSLELYRHVYLPGCLPAILTSLRLGLGTALAVLFLTETYATSKGIGYFIMYSWSSMAYDKMFAGIIAMGLMGFLLYIFLDGCERYLCSWLNP